MGNLVSLWIGRLKRSPPKESPKPQPPAQPPMFIESSTDSIKLPPEQPLAEEAIKVRQASPLTPTSLTAGNSSPSAALIATPNAISRLPATTPYEFIWKHGGQRVVVTGTFDGWQQTVVMTRDHAHRVFRATVSLPAGNEHAKVAFKFVVDGVWRCSLDWPCEADGNGNVNNVLETKALQKAGLQSLPLPEILRTVRV